MIDNFRRHRRIGALVFLVLFPACYNWRLAATPVLPEEVPRRNVRITRTDGSQTEFLRVRFSADTLIGFPDRRGLGQRVPLTAITRLETRKLAVAQTVVMGLVMVLPVAAMVVVALDPWDGPYPFGSAWGR